jgi:hypothetical protein
MFISLFLWEMSRRNHVLIIYTYHTYVMAATPFKFLPHKGTIWNEKSQPIQTDHLASGELKIYILTHKSCPDGTMAAAILRKYILSVSPDAAVHVIGVYPGKPLRHVLRDKETRHTLLGLEHASSRDSDKSSSTGTKSKSKSRKSSKKTNKSKSKSKSKVIPNHHHIVVCDICWATDELSALKGNALSIYIIDHHITNLENIRSVLGEDEYMFDVAKSACELAWLACYPASDLPAAVQFIGDVDVYRRAEASFQTSMHLHTAFGFHDLHNNIDAMQALLELSKDELMESYGSLGKLLFDFNQKRMQNAASKAVVCMIQLPSGKSVKVLTSPTIDGVNELGNHLVDESRTRFKFENPLALTYTYNLLSDEWVFSIRSAPDSTHINVGRLAKAFPNGGGHDHASGFTTKVHPRQILRPQKSR